jgi:hypothetical protein
VFLCRITRYARDPGWGLIQTSLKLLRSFLDFLLSSKAQASLAFVSNKKSRLQKAVEICLSGWQDSNLRPPGPKPGAMTGLRYTPKVGANIKLNFTSTMTKVDF